MSLGHPKAETFKVLLVEDNNTDAMLVREYLKKAQPEKFQLSRAKQISEAEEKLRTDLFDVILLDLSLPDCSGVESFERVAKLAGATPIVVLTGLDDNATEKHLIAQGAHDYLRKQHLDPKILAAVLCNAARKKLTSDATRRRLRKSAK
jgi:DNA-binding response OmpR family regulator